MGVHGLWRLVEPAGRPLHVDRLRGKVLAVDISIWLYQVVKGFQDAKGATIANAHLLGLFQRLCKLLYYGIKPIFVFDGSFPALKRQTIINRQKKKSENRNDLNKVQKQLMEVLMKHSAVQSIITNKKPSTSKKSSTKSSADEEDIFKLPTLSHNIDISSEESEEEITSSKHSYQDLYSINLNSDEFKQLPARKRHDILTELKETRKQGSWGSIHQLPPESQDFSNYQMSRLLKRRQLQVSLEETEKEIGGHYLSLNELEILLNEEGIDTKIENIPTRQIASNENARYVLVKDVKNAIDIATKLENEKNKQTNQDLPTSSSTEINLDNNVENKYDEDLQFAIQLSLQCADDNENNKVLDNNHKENNCIDNNSTSKNKKIENAHETSKIPQKNIAGNKFASAKAFMLEFSNLSEHEIDKIISSEKGLNIEKDSIKECDDTDISINKVNKIVEEEKKYVTTFTGINFNISPENNQLNEDKRSPSQAETSEKELVTNTKNNMETNDFQSNMDSVIVIESNTDSDDSFEEVPELNTNENSTSTKSSNIDNDIFSDIFTDKTSIEKLRNTLINEISNKAKNVEEEKRNIEEPVILNDSDSQKSSENDIIQKTKKVSNENSNIKSPAFVTDDINERLQDDNQEFVKNVTSDESEIENEYCTIGKTLNSNFINEMNTDLEKQKSELEIEQNKLKRIGRNISDEMTLEAQNLLKLFGIPFIIAPTEAEAQCAFLETIKLTDGTITDDSDIWLFGGKTVYRNFFNQQKHVLHFIAENIENCFKLQREDFILLALLVGSDYTIGVPGIGPVTALEILAAFPPDKTEIKPPYIHLLDGLKKFRNWIFSNDKLTHSKLRNKLKNVKLSEEFPNHKVVEAYLLPEIETSREAFSWGKPDLGALRDYTKEKFGWTREKTDQILNPVIKRLDMKISQTTMDAYFKMDLKLSTTVDKLSKRVKRAIDDMGKDPTDESKDNEIPVKKSRKKNVKDNAETSSSTDTQSSKKTRKQKTKAEQASDLIMKDDSNISLLPNQQESLEINTTIANSKLNSQEIFESKETILKKHTKDVIPQREANKNILLKNKLKAIELFRKSVKGPGFVKKRKKVALKPKDEAELSESSSSN